MLPGQDTSAGAGTRRAGVVISGYFGFGNAGDEAILGAMVRSLRQLMPALPITVLSARPERTRAAHGVKAISRTNAPHIMAELRRARLLISGGGGLMQDVTSVRSIAYYLGIIQLAKMMGVPVMLYAQSFGPIRSSAGRRMARAVVNRVDLISLRDRVSLDELGAAGITRPPVHITADPALLLEPAPPERGLELLASEGVPVRKAPLAGFALRPWGSSRGYLRAAAEAADHLSTDHGTAAVFLPMQRVQDLEVCEQVASMMKSPGWVIRGSYSPEEILSMVGQMRLLVGMRLHSLIFSAIQKVPAIAVVYDPKVKGFAADCGMLMPGTADELGSDSLISAVREVFDRREELIERLEAALPLLQALARENARLAVSLLSSGGSP